MKGLLLSLLFLVQNPGPPPVRLKDTIKDFPRSELQLAVTGPISLDLNQSSRVAYEILAEMAGLNVIFDPDFRTVFMPFRVDKVDFLDALDRLSIQTGSFVEVLDSKTIIVSPNNQTKRRDYERMVLKTFYPANRKTPQDLTAIITTLRTTLNLRYIAQSVTRNAIVLRDTPDRIAAAEKIIADVDRLSGNPTSVLQSSAPIDTGTETVGLLGSRALRKLAPSQSELQIKASGVISINMAQDSRSAYETLADMAGINIVFDPDFRSSPISLKLQNATVLDALDMLSMQVRSFWEVLDSKTILVSPDNQTKRRDYSRTFVKTIHLPDATTPTEIVEIITALRTLLNMRYIAQVPSGNAIVIHDTPNRLAVAEKVLADLTRPSTSPVPVASTRPFEAGSETGGVLRSRAVRKIANAQSQLQLKVTTSLTVELTGDARQSYERLAEMAGITVVFDTRFQNAPVPRFSLKNVDVIDGLDFLSLQSRTFWQVLDAKTIIVAPDNQTVRRELEPQMTKTIQLSKLQTPEAGVEIVTALRTLLNFSRQVQAIPNGVILRDTPENIALAERLVADLDK